MVHADIEIARTEKFLESSSEDTEFLHPLRQMFLKRSLLLFQPGDVGVTEHGNAVWRERDRAVNRRPETGGGLVREAVNQVHVEAFEAEFACGDDQIARH